jgi:peroxiredoxin
MRATMVVLAATCAFGRVSAIESGARAPAFELEMIGDGRLESSELFSGHTFTFLVFWQSGCPHCVEELIGCESFLRAHETEGVGAIGIFGGDENPLEVRALVESHGVTFAQARDAGDATKASYGVPYGAFTVCLVGADGRILGVAVDPRDDIDAVMEKMLRDSETAPAAGRGPGEPSRFSYHGLQRIRFLGIDSRGSGVSGLYGEPASPGNSVFYRLEVEASQRVARHLRVGGLLRISNEGARVLESGPEYFGSEWGSAFAEIDARRFEGRLGYFEIFMTPLTLMRWDWNDNPRVGGDAGCGCGAAAGALLIQSLEELGPTLTFEGGVVSYEAQDFDLRLFYAIPRRALTTSYGAFRAGADQRARYALELYGFEAKWERLDARTGGLWKVGLHGVGSFENDRSVDFAALGYAAADPATSTRIVSLSSEAPLVKDAWLRGEIILWNDWDVRGIVTLEGTERVSRRGGGGLGGIVVETSDRFGLAVDYLRLDPDFSTPFSAFSYEANTEGPRVSIRAPLPVDAANVSVFYKALREADVPVGADRKRTSLWGASLDFDVIAGVGAGAGWLEERSWRHGGPSAFRAYRGAIVGSLDYRFETVGVLRFQYERTRNTDSSPDSPADSRADFYSVYGTVYF